jgi:hypothetical protein
MKEERKIERKISSQHKAIEFLYIAICMGIMHSYEEQIVRLFYLLCNPYSIPLVLAAIFGVVSLLARPITWVSNFIERAKIPASLIFIFDFTVYFLLSRYL